MDKEKEDIVRGIRAQINKIKKQVKTGKEKLYSSEGLDELAERCEDLLREVMEQAIEITPDGKKVDIAYIMDAWGFYSRSYKDQYVRMKDRDRETLVTLFNRILSEAGHKKIKEVKKDEQQRGVREGVREETW